MLESSVIDSLSKYRTGKSKVHSFYFEFVFLGTAALYTCFLVTAALYTCFISLDSFLSDSHYILLIAPLESYFNANLQKEQNFEVKLNPFWVSGFCDGEAAFIIKIRKNSKLQTG